MSEIPMKENLRDAIRRARYLMSNDLKAIPAEKAGVSPGGVGRTPLNIVAECAMANGQFADFFASGQFAHVPHEQQEALLAEYDSVQKVLAYLDKETDRLLTALESLDESTLGEISDQIHGRPRTRLAIAQLPATHMMYHDGQLNYIQALYGDAEMHWG